MAAIPSTVPAPWRAVLAARASSAATRAAVAAIPGALAMLDGLEAFHAVDVARLAPPSEDAAFIAARDELVGLAASGTTLDAAGWLDRAAGIAHAGRTAEALANLHHTTRAQLGRVLGDLLTTGSGPAFGILAAELARILDEARTLNPDELTTADAALRAGRADDWARAAALADQLADVRRAAVLLHDAHADRITGHRFYPVASRMRGAADDWPGWSDYVARGMTDAGMDDPGFGLVLTSPRCPWPELTAPDGPAVRVAWLTWAVRTAGPTPWVPTPGELATELERLAFITSHGRPPEEAPTPEDLAAAARERAERRAIGWREPTERETARALKRAGRASAYGPRSSTGPDW